MQLLPVPSVHLLGINDLVFEIVQMRTPLPCGERFVLIPEQNVPRMGETYSMEHKWHSWFMVYPWNVPTGSRTIVYKFLDTLVEPKSGIKRLGLHISTSHWNIWYRFLFNMVELKWGIMRLGLHVPSGHLTGSPESISGLKAFHGNASCSFQLSKNVLFLVWNFECIE